MKRFWNRKFVDFFDLAKEINIFNEHFGPRIAFYFAFINTYAPLIWLRAAGHTLTSSCVCWRVLFVA